MELRLRGRLLRSGVMSLMVAAVGTGATLGVAGHAAAQTTTAIVRGVVRGAAAGSQVSVRDPATNQALSAPIGPDGSYTLSGLRPGAYELTVTGADGAPRRRDIVVSIGQSVTLDIDASAPAPAADAAPEAGGGEVVVTARRLVETRTSEVATNVSQAQIRNLPQTDRNFLSFAALAPGVRYNDTEFGRGFTAGAGNAADVNVFIDGLSLKNNVLAGGIAGQQGSRGNPFPQLAVSEFRVLTQNYKAEYEQASSAIITSLTKSGSNEFHGEAFFQYTDKSLTDQDVFSKRLDLPKPDYERKQYGASLGGPIVKDKLFFFGAYERNDQVRSEQVRLNSDDPALTNQFAKYLGFFASPFEEDLYFGKLTWTPDDRQTFDLSVNIRQEDDIRDFGRNTAYSSATRLKNEVDTYLLRHTFRGDGFVNEAAVSFLDYEYNPAALTDAPTTNYSGYIQVGGASSTQDVSQKTYTLRDDLTVTGFRFRGDHVFKMGVRYSHQDYHFDDRTYSQPYFEYRVAQSGALSGQLDQDVPYLANLGVGDPVISAQNNQLGVYAQDDWQVNPHLQLNIGLRWDYEDNMFDNDFVTPANAAATLRALPRTFYYTNPEDFISNGNRPTDKAMFQPRLGFSYDVFADQRTVVFGGYGHYYDRNVFSNTLNERYRQQYNIATFFFSRDGSVNPEGQPTVVFDPKYLTRAGLESLRAQAQTGFTELFVVKNDSVAPQTDQFTLGLRQRFGPIYTSIAGTYIKGDHGETNIFVNRDTANGDCCVTGVGTPAGDHGYSYVTTVIDAYKTRYKGLYVTIEKPYTDASRWGFSLAYTLSKATQNGDPSIYGGSGFYSYNCLDPASCGYHARANDARHNIVLSGQVLLPFDVRLSTLTTLTSPQPYLFEDYTNGFSYSTQNIQFDRLRQNANCMGAFARCTVDVKLQKEFPVPHRAGRLNLYLDIFNLFNNHNYGQYDGYTGYGGEVSTTFGQPLDLATRPRSFQFGAAYRF